MTAVMNDRSALNSFLKEAGFATSGDLVLLEPERSETKEIRAGEKAVVATVSTRARDRHGDIVDPLGVRLDRFRKNPVVLYAHDYDALPVARSLWERVRPSGSGRRGDCELIAKPQFHLDTELSREVWALVEKGVLSAWSVGFIPEKWEPLPEDQGGGFRVREWDLLEYSCVPVPANFQALTHELKARRITAPALMKSLAPLGFKGPDLVPSPIHHGDTENTEKVNCLNGPQERGTKDPAVHGTEKGADKDRPETSSKTPRGPDVAVLRELRASVVRDVVARAFDRYLLRAKGG